MLNAGEDTVNTDSSLVKHSSLTKEFFMSSSHLFTSESVTEGHPDKTADIISDTILDAVLKRDPEAKVAVETLLGHDLIVIAGEITTTNNHHNYDSIAREAVTRIGFNDKKLGLDGRTANVFVNLTKQSSEISGGVFNALEGRTEAGTVDERDYISRLGAGDQGILFGYANSDNDSYFPAAGKLAHMLSAKLTSVRKERANSDNVIRPDGKTQVTLRYENGYPVAIDTILVSTQHSPSTSLLSLQGYVLEEVILPVIADYNENHAYGRELEDLKRYLINPAGTWNVGSSASDSGLTGRKIIVDSYCGYARHGGGCYSGKEVTKTDRSGAYALRWIAKNLVAAGVAEELELQVSYAIGSVEPVSFFVDTKGKPSIGANEIEGVIKELFDLRPGAIIRDLKLKSGDISFAETAKNGHFGRNPSNMFTWERLDKVTEIKSLLGL